MNVQQTVILWRDKFPEYQLRRQAMAEAVRMGLSLKAADTLRLVPVVKPFQFKVF